MGEIVAVSPELMALLSGNAGAGGLAPFTREIFLLDITVAGTTFCKKINELAPLLVEGTILKMQRDPDNKHDEYAIGIYLDHDRIGWVPRDLNLIVARLMDAGKAFVCRVTGTKWKNEWLKIDAKVWMVE